MEYWKKITDDSVFIKEKDRKLLKKCKKYYKAVAVCMSTQEIQQSISFSFGAEHSIFGEPIKNAEIDGRPAIWKIVKAMEIEGGAGNWHQHQLKSEHGLTKASYLQIDGEWHYRLHPDVVEKVASKFGI
jgi:hypothetical protein